jgi:hypothetical protein
VGFKHSFVACCWSHLTGLDVLPQKFEECLKVWQLFHWRTGHEYFNFSQRMIQWQSLEIWSTLRTTVSGVNVTTKTGYLVNTSLVVLSVLVICYIFIVRPGLLELNVFPLLVHSEGFLLVLAEFGEYQGVDMHDILILQPGF